MLVHDVIMASSGSEGNSSWFALLFLLSGPAYFFFMYMRYRNTDKRHLHESETIGNVDKMKTIDTKVETVKGSSKSQMSGANHRDVRG